MKDPGPAGMVAIILAAGISTALNIVTMTIAYAVVTGRLGILGENTTQLLLAWGGGIVSVIAGYIGYVLGRSEE